METLIQLMPIFEYGSLLLMILMVVFGILQSRDKHKKVFKSLFKTCCILYILLFVVFLIFLYFAINEYMTSFLIEANDM